MLFSRVIEVCFYGARGGNARTRFQYPPLGNTACFGCNHS